MHLRPTAPLAERVLLPGDPHRALAVAQAILEEPKMFNHTRGLWGYTGRAADGDLLTVQATGMGGPSTAVVAEELIDLGATVLVRIGTCGALVGGYSLGELVVAQRVIGADGASAALGVTGSIAPDGVLTASLRAAGARATVAVTSDLFYDDRNERAQEWVRCGAEVVEMEAATLLAVTERRRVAGAVLLAVTDLLEGDGRDRLDDAAVQAIGIRLGEIAWEALAS